VPGAGQGDVVPRWSVPSAQELPGRFEREFVEIDEVGSGEFGRVIKVRRKGHAEIFAVKKSKMFEGVKHR
jgi:mitosis inhibitor protein kinase SWE1